MKRTLTFTFVDTAADEERLNYLCANVKHAVLDKLALRLTVWGGSKVPEKITKVFGIFSSQPLSNALSLVEEIVDSRKDLVVTTNSTGAGDNITVTHKNTLREPVI